MTPSPFTRIAVAGAGTRGSQVAWQMSFHGKVVTVYYYHDTPSGDRYIAATIWDPLVS